MTIAVLAATTTKTKRREPLGTIGMAASQAQSRPASSASGRSRGERRTTRLSATQQGLEEDTGKDAKRKADYEEDEEGFQFSRMPSKKSKPSVEPVPELPLQMQRTRVQNPPAKEAAAEPVNRRPTRGAAKTASTETEPQSANASRSLRNRDPPEVPPEEKKRKKGRPGRPKVYEPEPNGFKSPEQPTAGTKVALPAADTPVIQRNKELRGGNKPEKGRRRSSLGMRGRRASSLIDSGTSNALPHREVGTADFYKHIADDGLSEPRRMRQLLIWCATRAMGDKPSGSHSEDQSARLAARVIQEELLKEFSSNSELSNWFDREDVNPPAVVVKKPNPRNVQNTDKIKELEQQIQKLQRERHALNALIRQPTIPRIDAAPDAQSDLPKTQRPASKSKRDPIDPSLLDASQHAILALLDPSTQSPEGDSSTSPAPQPPLTPSAVSSRLSRITTGLAPTLDTFAAGMHDIELYRATSDTVSSRILHVCARRLEERDAHNTQRRLAIEGSDSEKRPRHPTTAPPRQDLGLILGALSRVERR
ncbi:hypothetical protein NUU61_003384 [Penicillium alfredii]|uniref:Uncharacterized protein n=1 Tax=Penicillium alfredii TaxID=1506179 RepID=A0A9W9KI36_9EURO|nr:uncharacterized protein NUU61_003384 [Penicillium alfredii]KAJ5106037.1 hypothetical protein NUU61_003384 [Penicillium alfredii]